MTGNPMCLGVGGRECLWEGRRNRIIIQLLFSEVFPEWADTVPLEINTHLSMYKVQISSDRLRISCITDLSDINGGEKVPLSWLINPGLSHSMHNTSFQEIPLAVLAACIYHSLTNAAVRNLKVSSAKHTLLHWSTYARNKTYFKMWILIYHNHSTKYSYLAKHLTLYLNKSNQRLFFMPAWVCYSKMLVIKQQLHSGQKFTPSSNTSVLYLPSKKMKIRTLWLR